ncbi:polysaccharide pyruvyl transferase family protein [Sphingobacterium siyangense subsp. cladoniae]|uniref:polysaccharide pyruvyl transferase family protein n=1 Tax=Sphingobacterium siyangense TaxID=459529 RepID=UPI0031F891A9
MINLYRIKRRFSYLLKSNPLKIIKDYRIKRKLSREWNDFIYGDLNRPVESGKVNLYYFKHGVKDNVGDLLSKTVVTFVEEKLNLQNEMRSETRRLFAIGSIIDVAKSDMIVWGSGLRNENSLPPNVKLDIRAVRGPLTREKLIKSGFNCPQSYGDPALLLPLFYHPTVDNRESFIIIPHYSKEKNIPEKYQDKVVSTITSDWKDFVNKIISSEFVISGSLHGIIIAEAYGIPAVLINEIDFDLFKYKDYYESTDRRDFVVYQDVDDVLSRMKFNDPIPNLAKLQESLLSSFPKDIY